MLPVENTTYGRVADIHRLLPQSGPAHRRRGLRAGAHQPARRARSDDRRCEGRPGRNLVLLPQCARFLRENGIAGRVSTDNARAARRRGRAGGQGRRRRSHRNSRERSTGWTCWRAISRITTATRTRFLIMAQEPDMTRRGRSHDDDLRLPRAQHSSRALQGHGWVRHERREHDQAGKLHDRRLLHRGRSSMPTSKATPTTGTCNWRWKSWSTSPAISRFWAPTPPTPPRD